MISSSTSYPHWTQVYGEGAGKDEWPRAYRSISGDVRVYSSEDNYTVFFKGEGPNHCSKYQASWRFSEQYRIECGDTLLTGPEAAEYVAAAREGRDAVWPKAESDPWPHWWVNPDGNILVRHDDSGASTVFEPDDISGWKCPHSEEYHKIVRYRRITAAEAAAKLAEWEKAKAPAPLPTPEEVAETIITQQCGIGRPAKYDPDQQVRLSYAAGLIANAIHRDRRSRESSELAKPECRVKHDWTGAMGTVLMEHGGTSFVKWDDGQVTSVYNRHLQKELV